MPPITRQPPATQQPPATSIEKAATPINPVSQQLRPGLQLPLHPNQPYLLVVQPTTNSNRGYKNLIPVLVLSIVGIVGLIIWAAYQSGAASVPEQQPPVIINPPAVNGSCIAFCGS